MLQLTVLVSGAVLMALEMLGSRVLAPQFGNSIFVWGSLIGVILTALSAGYYLGGRLADRHPSLPPLARVLALAGVWTWLLPEAATRVNAWLAARDLGPRLGALVASLALFAGPALLLALVSPWAVRLAAREIRSVGSTAGVLYALSTGGSIAGTLVTSFFLIPAFGVADLLRSCGLVLLALAALDLAAARRRAQAIGVTALTALLLFTSAVLRPPALFETGAPARIEPPRAVGGGMQPGVVSGGPAVGEIRGPFEDGVVFEKESLYHHIRVENAGGSRYLRFDNSWQSGMYLDDPLRARFEYTDYLLLPFALRPDAGRALMVGLGGGSVVKKLLAYRPDLRLDVAELDPVVVEVARTYFGVPDNPRLTVHVEDGRRLLDRAGPAYDVILLDAYYADAIPFHLTTREFLGRVRARLTDGGLVAANLIGALEGPRSALLRSMARTFATVFPEVYLFPVGGRSPDTYQNVILLAPREPHRWSREDIVKAAEAQADALGTPSLPEYAAALHTRPLPVDDVPVLTDDHAPVDALLHLYE
ncbi:fused MFS/spermidine synthase [Caldinitratiruptor microaerophilus]|uniref:PABS domain-containing protein n=1 Tax=Caldinitratiruptor microaerophilus TaxID=671077 RepID=A0AA35G7R0_9FIRM|nr:fused MFS/spermidine synthase [Caldinitratiruptor microaerophilus]BDG59583.1 hypothetical protein caldi_06730 [Caldinitratiruptor microaerophilus]